jgi:hypothetical protein
MQQEKFLYRIFSGDRLVKYVLGDMKILYVK